MNIHTRSIAGFALPTVLISSVILIALLAAAMQSVLGTRSSLNDQYYEQMARAAAESGMAQAKACMAANNQNAQWNNTDKLYPQTSCAGGQQCRTNNDCFVVSSGNNKSWYEVAAPTVTTPTSRTLTSRGVAEEVSRSTGSVVRTYEYEIKSRFGADVTLEKVTFGYNTSGGYFAAIDGSGKMYTLGYNSDGQLGNGSLASSTKPTTFQLPTGMQAASAYTNFLSNGNHMFAITTTGDAYAAGLNNFGQLGVGNTTTPTTIPRKVNLGTQKVRYVEMLRNTSFFVTTANEVFAVGSCGNGLLGVNYTISGCMNRSTPIKVHVPAGITPTRNFVVDRLNAYFLASNGAVYGWGANDFGQLANYSYTESSVPIQISNYNGSTNSARNIGFDGRSIYVVNTNGRVWAAGSHTYGQLGIGVAATTAHYRGLTQMAIPAGAGNAVKVSTDQWSVSVLTDTGEVWGAGLNNRGQLGNGNTTNQSTPVKFQLPAGVKAVDVYNTSVGDTNYDANSVFVIGDNGRVYGAGGNAFGQLGDGTTTARSTPVAMSVIDGVNVRAQQVVSGYGTTVILTEDKKIYTVGNNSHGQLGDGTTTNSSTPRANRFTNILPALYY